MAMLILSACYDDRKMAEYDYKNGDEMAIVPQLEVPYVDSVQFYWDNKHIATERAMPFIHRRVLRNERSGMHIVRYTVHYNYYVQSDTRRSGYYEYTNTYTVK